jgi:hypothetical protein
LCQIVDEDEGVFAWKLCGGDVSAVCLKADIVINTADAVVEVASWRYISYTPAVVAAALITDATTCCCCCCCSGPLELEYDLLIGADGSGSAVRDALAAAMPSFKVGLSMWW